MSNDSEHMLSLGRQAVATPGWRWVPGMLAMTVDGPMPPVRLTGEQRPGWPDEYDWPHDLGLRVPDLSDTDTLACLLGVVRAAYPEAHEVGVVRAFHNGRPYVRLNRSGAVSYIYGSTIGEALVMALEAAVTR